MLFDPHQKDNWEFLLPAYGTLCRTRLAAGRYLSNGAPSIGIYVADDTTEMFRYYDMLSFDYGAPIIADGYIVVAGGIQRDTLQAVVESGFIEDEPCSFVKDQGMQLGVFSLTDAARKWFIAQPGVMNYDLGSMFQVQQ